jgi:cytidylate kinase
MSSDDLRRALGPAPLVVAIDGPSGSGKSTTARAVATELGLRYLDTGAMYRAVTWWMLDQGIDVTSEPAIVSAVRRMVAEGHHVDLSTDPGDQLVRMDGIDITEAIRGGDVTAAVSAVSAVPQVRAVLVARQRSLIEGGDVVIEGRDIGTVVAPEASVKIFLTAAIDARADRRHAELVDDGASELLETQADLFRRDVLDSSRTVSPLSVAPDALVIDSTEMEISEVIRRVISLVDAQRRTAAN